MIHNRTGFEELVQIIESTRNMVRRADGYSLVDAVFDERDGHATCDALREWLYTSLGDFVNGYAAELTACIDSLITSGNLDEADIAAAEALPELVGQLRFVYDNQKQADVPSPQVATVDDALPLALVV